MPKEYRTIQEVAGPLMLVRGVENVHFDELGEIELASGEAVYSTVWDARLMMVLKSFRMRDVISTVCL